jgi:hypothetical protein
MAKQDPIRDIKRRISAALLDTPGVSGVGIRDGRITIYLERDDAAVKTRARALAAKVDDVELQFDVAGRFGKQ